MEEDTTPADRPPMTNLSPDQFGEHIWQPGDRVSGGWRGSNSTAPRNKSLADTLDFEEQELGNEPELHPRVKEMLRGVPAQHGTWVTRERDQAQTYGEPYEVHFKSPGLVLTPDDGDGGHLVLHSNPEAIQQVEQSGLLGRKGKKR